MKGIKKHQADSQSNQRSRLPITPVILMRLHKHDTVMIWAVSCLPFFGYLRVSEFTVQSDDQYYDSGAHLSLSDIGFDNASNPLVMQVTIKQSKMDPFRKGVSLVLGRTFNFSLPSSSYGFIHIIFDSEGGQAWPPFPFQGWSFSYQAEICE